MAGHGACVCAVSDSVSVPASGCTPDARDVCAVGLRESPLGESGLETAVGEEILCGTAYFSSDLSVTNGLFTFSIAALNLLDIDLASLLAAALACPKTD